jgi:excisionase family DNA binding protein
MPMRPLLDKADVADLLRVSVRTIDRLRVSGELRAVRVRGRVLFNPQDVQAFVNAQRKGRRP